MTSRIVDLVRQASAMYVVSVARSRKLSMDEVRFETANALAFCEQAENCTAETESEDVLNRLWVLLAWSSREPDSFAARVRHLVGVRIGLGHLA